MNSRVTQFAFLFLFVISIFTACKKEDEWARINAINPEATVANQLNEIVGADNSCLLMTNNKSEIKVIFSSENFAAVDNCNEVPDIDFSNSTLIIGKVEILSISDKIGGVSLSLLNSTYKIEVTLDRCAECEEGTGYAYFWRLFPKMELGYNLELDIN
ncbi:MAG: hypothetical protein HQ522_10815 [Bacteroidetes bacterium]|nr:hypothetical protein [Bacteroidota bacterium]